MWHEPGTWISLLPMVAAIVCAIYVWVAVRHSRSEALEQVIAALEKRVQVLEADLKDSRQEVFDLDRKLRHLKDLNDTIGSRNEKLQVECERLEQRVRQLEAAMVRAGIPVPPEED